MGYFHFSLSNKAIILLPILLVACYMLCPRFVVANDEPAGIEVSVAEDAIQISVSHHLSEKFSLVEQLPWETTADAIKHKPIATESKPNINLPRFHNKRDRLYSKWQLINAETGQPLGPAQAVTQFSDPREHATPLLENNGIKGVQCIVGLDDAISLGIKQAAHNVLISQIIDLNPKPGSHFHMVDGTKIGINIGYIKQLDSIVKKLTDAGVNVTLILLNAVPTKSDGNNPLIHPQTNLAEAPNHLGAFNLTSKRGYLCYRAATEFLAHRYSLPTKQHGLVSGIIIGNELQAHWWWYNIGDALPKTVIADYAKAVRIAQLAAQKAHPRLRIFVSMDHHWTAAMSENKQRFIPGKTLLDLFNAEIKQQGNVPWHLAAHPYPQNLFDPRTWNDEQARLDFETPKITFRNLEVLPAYLSQPHFQIDGKTRRIILSEQGFHRPDGANGDQIQAAAYAYAFYRSQHVEGIDAFILHRHIDHAHEGGLKLGLRAHRPGTITTPGTKRKIYDIFRAADTPDWKTAFEFAKPIIGIKNWDELDSQPVRSD